MTTRHIIYNWHISKFNFYLGLILAGGIILFLVCTKHLSWPPHPAAIILEPFLLPPIQAVCDSKTISTEAALTPAPTKAKLPDTITPAPTQPQQTQQFTKPTAATVTCNAGLNIAPPPVAVQNTIISYINELPAPQINQVIENLKTNPVTVPLVSEYEPATIKLIAGLIILLNNVAMYSSPTTESGPIQLPDKSAPLTQEEKNVVGYVLNAMLNSINPVISQFTNKYFSGQEPDSVIRDLLANIQPAPPAIKPDDLTQIMSTPIRQVSAEQAQTSELYITEQIKKGNVSLDAEKCISMLESGYRFA